MNSIRILLGGVIDYAGLFPPSSLGMTATVHNFANYFAGEQSFLLGRLIVPVRRLGEFEDAASDLLPRGNPVYPWRLSATGGGDLMADLEKIVDFNLYHAKDENAGAAVVDTFELKVESLAEIQRALYLIPRTLTTYFEIPITTNPADLLEAIGAARARAKVRTGGVTPNAFPDLNDLARFIRLCAEQRVPFKATAGLHHAWCGNYPLTYEKDSELSLMNGFLNLFLATAFARFDMDEESIREILAEQSAAAFTFDEEGVQWRRHRLTTEQLALTRQQIICAFGSCSFEEPVSELQAMKLL